MNMFLQISLVLITRERTLRCAQGAYFSSWLGGGCPSKFAQQKHIQPSKNLPAQQKLTRPAKITPSSKNECPQQKIPPQHKLTSLAKNEYSRSAKICAAKEHPVNVFLQTSCVLINRERAFRCAQRAYFSSLLGGGGCPAKLDLQKNDLQKHIPFAKTHSICKKHIPFEKTPSICSCSSLFHLRQ